MRESKVEKLMAMNGTRLVSVAPYPLAKDRYDLRGI